MGNCHTDQEVNNLMGKDGYFHKEVNNRVENEFFKT